MPTYSSQPAFSMTDWTLGAGSPDPLPTVANGILTCTHPASPADGGNQSAASAFLFDAPNVGDRLFNYAMTWQGTDKTQAYFTVTFSDGKKLTFKFFNGSFIVTYNGAYVTDTPIVGALPTGVRATKTSTGVQFEVYTTAWANSLAWAGTPASWAGMKLDLYTEQTYNTGAISGGTVTFQVMQDATVSDPVLALAAARRVVSVTKDATTLPTIAPVAFSNSGGGNLGSVTAALATDAVPNVIVPVVNTNAGQIEFAAGAGFAAWCAAGGRSLVVKIVVTSVTGGSRTLNVMLAVVGGAVTPSSATSTTVQLRYQGTAAAIGDVPIVTSSDPTIATGTATPLVAGSGLDAGLLLSTLTVTSATSAPGTATISASVGAGVDAIVVSVPVSIVTLATVG